MPSDIQRIDAIQTIESLDNELLSSYYQVGLTLTPKLDRESLQKGTTHQSHMNIM